MANHLNLTFEECETIPLYREPEKEEGLTARSSTLLAPHSKLFEVTLTTDVGSEMPRLMERWSDVSEGRNRERP